MKKYKHILLAIDLYGHNELIIQKAISLVEQNSSDFSIVNVLNDIELYFSNDAPNIIEIQDYLESENNRKLKLLEAKIHTKANYFFMHGSAKRKIIECSESNGCDLIVMGSHTHDDENSLMGETAIGVLYRSKCDVLIVKC